MIKVYEFDSFEYDYYKVNKMSEKECEKEVSENELDAKEYEFSNNYELEEFLNEIAKESCNVYYRVFFKK